MIPRRYCGFSDITTSAEEAVCGMAGLPLGSSCCKASPRHGPTTCYLLALLFPERLLFLMWDFDLGQPSFMSLEFNMPHASIWPPLFSLPVSEG